MEDQQLLELATGSWPVAVTAVICLTLIMLARMFRDDIAARIRGEAKAKAQPLIDESSLSHGTAAE